MILNLNMKSKAILSPLPSVSNTFNTAHTYTHELFLLSKLIKNFEYS